MAQTKPKAGQFYGVSNNGTDGQFLKTDGTGGMSWDSPIANPTITSIDYPGTATAADPAGGESVIINGTLFASGVTCTVGGTSAVTAFNSANQITITTPAKAAGQYTVAITNLDGGTVSQANFIQYSGVPVWSTAAGNIGSVQEGATASFQVTATEGSDTIEYAVTTGSLPSGLSLNTNTGAITGTAPAVSADTTTTFSITATDDENQTSSARSFNITVTADLPSNYFTPIIWTGNSSSRSITSLNFSPDLVWIKDRDNSRNHCLFDTVRGPATNLNIVYSDISNGQSTNVGSGFLSDTTSNGFNLGNSDYVNGSSNNYVAWCFKAGGEPTATNTDPAGGVPTNGSVMIDGVVSTAALAGDIPIKKMSVNNNLGFSIVNFTGTYPGTGYIPHGLSGTPELVILKQLDGTFEWLVVDVVNQVGGYLNHTDSFTSSRYNAWLWSKNPSSTTVPLNAYTYVNGTNMLVYSFISKPGFSKVGTYTGTSASGNLISTGFEPAFLMIKRTDSTGSWIMLDDKRSTSNPRTKYLTANTSDVEGDSASIDVDFLTNGFSVSGTNSDINVGSYIYLAFATDPSTTTPSLANSFDTTLWSNGVNQHQSPITGVGFKPDLTWIKSRNSGTDHVLTDSVRGVTKTLFSNLTSNEVTVAQGLTAFNSDGFALGNDSRFNPDQRNQVSWNWKAGGTSSINTDGSITSLVSANQAAGFSIVQHVSNNSNDTIGHGLSSAPEFIISKNRTVAGGWGVYNAISGTGAYLYLDTNGSEQPGGTTVYPTVNNTVFAPGSGGWNFGTGNTYIHYCFKSITGYSKVGSYVGTGTTISAINVGFAPGFVMIKGLGNSGNWAMVDSKRGGTSRDQLDANDAHAEYANQGLTFTSTGFSPRQTLSSDMNTSGITYIYLAIKEN